MRMSKGECGESVMRRYVWCGEGVLTVQHPFIVASG